MKKGGLVSQVGGWRRVRELSKMFGHSKNFYFEFTEESTNLSTQKGQTEIRVVCLN